MYKNQLKKISQTNKLIKKGLAFIRSNDTLTNLGRYWPNTGKKLYLKFKI